jgi:pseudouridine kinase
MIACIGGAHLDRHGVLRGPLVLGTSNPGDVRVEFGGVARNVAENLARLGRKVTLLSRVGDDDAGRQVLRHAEGIGIDTGLVTVSEARPTASYTAILENSGELVLGLVDRDIYTEITPALVEPMVARLDEHELWFIDANTPAETINWLLTRAGERPAAVDAVSVVLARGLRPLLPRIPILFANVAQAASVAGVEAQLDAAQAATALQQLGARAGIVTAGAAGIAVWRDGEVQSLHALPARPRDVTGAGDALVAGTLFGLSQGAGLAEAAQLGLAAAAITVESPHASDPYLTLESARKRLAAQGHHAVS